MQIAMPFIFCIYAQMPDPDAAKTIPCCMHIFFSHFNLNIIVHQNVILAHREVEQGKQERKTA
jgi:hypothetical protein